MTRSHRSSDVAGVALPKQAGHALVVPLPAEKAEREGEGGLGGAGRTGAEARRTEDEDAGVVAKDSQGAEATWVKVKGGDVKLPEWACDRPSLVWLWAEVSQPTTSPKVRPAVAHSPQPVPSWMG